MPDADAPSLPDQLRATTHEMHVRAERSGFVSQLIRGEASRGGYALFLRNLLPVYEAMEEALDRHGSDSRLAWLADPAIYRSRRIESDLQTLCGPGFSSELPLLRSGDRYAQRVMRAAEDPDDPSGLVGHAYVRYLGDLNGGRTLVRRLADTLDLEPEALSFYAYPGVQDLEEFKKTYRAGFEAAGSWADTESAVDEALAAFALNIEVSEEVKAQVETETRRG